MAHLTTASNSQLITWLPPYFWLYNRQDTAGGVWQHHDTLMIGFMVQMTSVFITGHISENH